MAALCTACGGGGGEDAPPEEVRVEANAGDGPGSAEFLGRVAPGDSLAIQGSVTAFDADPFDTFLIEADAATRVEFDLSGLDGESVDLDFWVATTEAEVLERFELGSGAPETGAFDMEAGEARLLVVLTGVRDADYELSLEALTPSAPASE